MGPHYWEIIEEQIRAEGWSIGWVAMAKPGGVTIYQADARKDDGRRFIARAENLSVAFHELQEMLRQGHA